MPEQNGNTPNLGASLAALRDSLKLVHPANIYNGTKALTRFMAEQIVIDDPAFDDPTITPAEYRAVLEEAGNILTWRTMDHGSDQAYEAAFLLDVKDYAKLLGAVHGWIFFLREIDEAEGIEVADDLLVSTLDEITRISANLGIEVFGYERHRGEREIGFDPISTYLHEADLMEIVRRKNEMPLETVAATVATEHRAKKPGFDKCANFDETVKGYQTQAVNVLRSLSGRISALAKDCAAKIGVDSRQDALLFCEKVDRAAEVINAK